MLLPPPSKRSQRSADSPAAALAAAVLSLTLAAPAFAQAPAAVPVATHISNLSSLDYPTRMNAARQIRRAPAAEAAGALVQAVRSHQDEFVRFRALVVFASFNDPKTRELMAGLLSDRNDRVREAAYKWLEANPDTGLTRTLLAALQTELAEFVRPALIGALAALGSDPLVQRALIGEVGRGVDFFRSAVIDALGRHHAAYAVDAIAAIARLDGPLQDDAVLALGRIGGVKAGAELTAIGTPAADVVPTVRAALCLMGNGCDAAIRGFVESASTTGSPASVVRASFAALGAVAASGSRPAMDALVVLAGRGGGIRAQAALALGAAAVRAPDALLGWLEAMPAAQQDSAIELLKEGFEDLEEDFGEEMFFAAARSAYWKADEGSAARTLTAALIQKLEF